MIFVSFTPTDISSIDSENGVAWIVKRYENVGDWTCLAAFELDGFGPVAVFENLQDPVVVAF